MADSNLVSLHLVDDAGNRKTIEVFFPTSFTLAQLQGWATQFATDVDGAIGAVIEKMTVTLGLTIPGGVKSTPDAGSNAHVGGLATFDAAGTTYSFGMYFPTWALFTGNDMDVTSGSAPDVITDLVTGVTVSGTPITPSDKFANDLVALLKHKRVQRK